MQENVIREAFRESGFFLERVVGGIRDDQWETPGLGVWTVRELTGHASRALLTVEAYLAAPARQVDIPNPAAYFAPISATSPEIAALNDQVAQRGREAAKALGNNPLKFVARTRTRVQALVDCTQDDALMTVLSGKGIRLIDYLPSRVLELVVHSIDLVRATGQAIHPPTIAMRVCLHLMADVVILHGNGEMLALALTGRTTLPDRFTIVP